MLSSSACVRTTRLPAARFSAGARDMSKTAPPPPYVWPLPLCCGARPTWEPSSVACEHVWGAQSHHRHGAHARAARLPHAQARRTIRRQRDEVLRGKISGARNTQHPEEGQGARLGNHSQSGYCRTEVPSTTVVIKYQGSKPFLSGSGRTGRGIDVAAASQTSAEDAPGSANRRAARKRANAGFPVR